VEGLIESSDFGNLEISDHSTTNFIYLIQKYISRMHVDVD